MTLIKWLFICEWTVQSAHFSQPSHSSDFRTERCHFSEMYNWKWM